MWKDPIVEEVRKAGEELFKQANYDLHTLFENIRKSQKGRNIKVVSRVKAKSPDIVESVG
jgi:hypothetical protein